LSDRNRPQEKPPASAETVADRSAATSPSEQSTRTGFPRDLPSPGTTWGNLRILEELGAGAYGRVYKAWDTTLEREVALKIIRLHRSDPATTAAVLREGQMLARIRHRNVVTVHGAQRIADDVGLWMELVRGRPLARMIREDGPMGAEEAAVVGVSLCDALTAVHGAGLIHRDVKAQNVMRESGGRIVLMDFGTGHDLAVGQAGWGDMAGTPIYMAPEVLSEGAWSPAADLYSLGVLLFFLVTGGYPVEGRTFTDVALAYALGHRRLLVDSRPGLPENFVRIVERALAPRDRRYATAGQMMHDLADAIPGSGGRRDEPVSQRVGVTAVPVESAVRVPQALSDRGDKPKARWGRRAIATAGSVVIIWMLGFLTSMAFNNALGREEYSSEGLFTWLYWGARAVLGVVQYTIALILAFAVLRLLWWSAVRVIPPLRRGDAALRQRTWNRSTTAQWILGGQVVLLTAVCVFFRHSLAAYSAFLDDAAAWKLAVLQVGNTHVWYRGAMTWLLILMAVAWYKLLKTERNDTPIDRYTVAAGVAMIAVVLILLAAPFRLIYHSRFPRADVHGERCYATGERDGQVLVFCPDRPPPRVRVVNQRDVSSGPVERIFAPSEIPPR
jgi:hypothetical protein